MNMEQSLGYLQSHLLNLIEKEVEGSMLLDAYRQICFAWIISVKADWSFQKVISMKNQPLHDDFLPEMFPNATKYSVIFW